MFGDCSLADVTPPSSAVASVLVAVTVREMLTSPKSARLSPPCPPWLQTQPAAFLLDGPGWSSYRSLRFLEDLPYERAGAAVVPQTEWLS